MFSELVKMYRQKLGISQTELAKQLSVSQPVVSFWESGKRVPCKSSISKISKYLDKNVEKLVDLPKILKIFLYENCRFKVYCFAFDKSIKEKI